MKTIVVTFFCGLVACALVLLEAYMCTIWLLDDMDASPKIVNTVFLGVAIAFAVALCCLSVLICKGDSVPMRYDRAVWYVIVGGTVLAVVSNSVNWVAPIVLCVTVILSRKHVTMHYARPKR